MTGEILDDPEEDVYVFGVEDPATTREDDMHDPT